MQVYVFAACDVYYGSYYIYGLYKFFNKKNVHFNINKFPAFSQNTFAFIVEENNISTKIIIDFYDSAEIDLNWFSWCDVYGKINIKEEDFKNEQLNLKLISLGPGFGIKIWSLPKCLLVFISNFIKSFKLIKNVKQFFSFYIQQNKRLAFDAYKYEVSKKNYIFILNTIWKKSILTNQFRLRFIEACKAISNVSFEGGFVPRSKNDIPGFSAHTVLKRYDVNEYILKTKQSAIVFNTPAVLDCLGWKLGEFFALGKAIISTPLKRIMPEPGEAAHCFFPVKEDTFLSSIKHLLENDMLRVKLEDNSLKYFCKYLAPQKVIERLVQKAHQQSN